MKTFEKLKNMPLEDVLLFLVKPIIILLISKIVVAVLMKVFDKFFEKSKLDLGMQGFLKQIIRIAIYIVAFIMAINSLGVDTSSLVTILGIVSLAFSLALQGLLSNVFSGAVILITKPFLVGEFVEITGVVGTVSAITLMRTKINTPDNKVMLIPNSDVASSPIINYSNQDKRRVDIEVSASYDDDTKKVLSALNSVVEADSRIITEVEFKPLIRLLRFGAYDITYTIKVWCATAEYWNVYYDLLENIRQVYAERGITFSYPHTVIHIDTDKKEKKDGESD